MAESAKAHSSGNTKYIAGGVVLLLLAMVVLFIAWPKPAQAPAPETPAPVVAERVNPMAQPDLILEEAKDAGKPLEETAPPPKVVKREVRDEWDCGGDLERPALQGVIDSNRAQIRSCYERRLKTNNVLAGDLKLRLRVAPSGQVTATAVSGSLRDNEVFGCVRNIASKWSFPPPDNGCAVVQVPFQFSPKTN